MCVCVKFASYRVVLYTELWRPLVSQKSQRTELNIDACLLVAAPFAWSGLVFFFFNGVASRLFTYSLCASFARVASLVSVQSRRDVVITAGQLD